MQFQQGANVYTMDGEEAGQIDRIVIDPRTQEITHIVLRQGFLVSHSKVVPVDAIVIGPNGNLTVRMNPQQFQELPAFEEKEYILADESTNLDMPAPAGTFWYPQYLAGASVTPTPTPKYLEETRYNVPRDTVPVKEGARVISSDGEDVGQVEQVLTGVEKDLITHLLIVKGLLNLERRLIPVSWVNDYDETEVHLAVQAAVVQRLPLTELKD